MVSLIRRPVYNDPVTLTQQQRFLRTDLGQSLDATAERDRLTRLMITDADLQTNRSSAIDVIRGRDPARFDEEVGRRTEERFDRGYNADVFAEDFSANRRRALRDPADRDPFMDRFDQSTRISGANIRGAAEYGARESLVEEDARSGGRLGVDRLFMTKEEFEARNRDLGLKSYRAMSLGEEAILRERKRKELIELNVQALADQQTSWSLHGGYVLGRHLMAEIYGMAFVSVDPLEIGAMFLPVFGPGTRVANAARFGARPAYTAMGAAEAAVGSALIEAPYYLLSQRQQREWTWDQALINIGAGAAFGGLIGFGRGAYVGWRHGAYGPNGAPNPREVGIDDQGRVMIDGERVDSNAFKSEWDKMDPAEKSAAAGRLAIAQFAAGEEVNVSRLGLDLDVSDLRLREIEEQATLIGRQLRDAGVPNEWIPSYAGLVRSMDSAVLSRYGLDYGSAASLMGRMFVQGYTARSFAARQVAAGRAMEIGGQDIRALSRTDPEAARRAIDLASDDEVLEALARMWRRGDGEEDLLARLGRVADDGASYNPTTDWLDIPEGTPIPHGLEARIGMETGSQSVRLPERPTINDGPGGRTPLEPRIKAWEEAKAWLEGRSEAARADAREELLDDVAEALREALGGETLSREVVAASIDALSRLDADRIVRLADEFVGTAEGRAITQALDDLADILESKAPESALYQELARMRNRDAAPLIEAQRLDDQGVPMREIEARTGMFRGKDGMWRPAIHFDRVQFKGSEASATRSERGWGIFSAKRAGRGVSATLHGIMANRETGFVRFTLGDLLDAPDLFKHFPYLREVEIDVAYAPPTERLRGSADPSGRYIMARASTIEDLKETIAHEATHIVQQRQGYAQGGSPRQFGNYDNLVGELEAEAAAARASGGLDRDELRLIDEGPEGTLLWVAPFKRKRRQEQGGFLGWGRTEKDVTEDRNIALSARGGSFGPRIFAEQGDIRRGRDLFTALAKGQVARAEVEGLRGSIRHEAVFQREVTPSVLNIIRDIASGRNMIEGGVADMAHARSIIELSHVTTTLEPTVVYARGTQQDLKALQAGELIDVKEMMQVSHASGNIRRTGVGAPGDRPVIFEVLIPKRERGLVAPDSAAMKSDIVNPNGLLAPGRLRLQRVVTPREGAEGPVRVGVVYEFDPLKTEAFRGLADPEQPGGKLFIEESYLAAYQRAATRADRANYRAENPPPGDRRTKDPGMMGFNKPRRPWSKRKPFDADEFLPDTELGRAVKAWRKENRAALELLDEVRRQEFRDWRAQAKARFEANQKLFHDGERFDPEWTPVEDPTAKYWGKGAAGNPQTRPDLMLTPDGRYVTRDGREFEIYDKLPVEEAQLQRRIEDHETAKRRYEEARSAKSGDVERLRADMQGAFDRMTYTQQIVDAWRKTRPNKHGEPRYMMVQAFGGDGSGGRRFVENSWIDQYQAWREEQIRETGLDPAPEFQPIWERHLNERINGARDRMWDEAAATLDDVDRYDFERWADNVAGLQKSNPAEYRRISTILHRMQIEDRGAAGDALIGRRSAYLNEMRARAPEGVDPDVWVGALDRFSRENRRIDGIRSPEVSLATELGINGAAVVNRARDGSIPGAAAFRAAVKSQAFRNFHGLTLQLRELPVVPTRGKYDPYMESIGLMGDGRYIDLETRLVLDENMVPTDEVIADPLTRLREQRARIIEETGEDPTPSANRVLEYEDMTMESRARDEGRPNILVEGVDENFDLRFDVEGGRQLLREMVDAADENPRGVVDYTRRVWKKGDPFAQGERVIGDPNAPRELTRAIGGPDQALSERIGGEGLGGFMQPDGSRAGEIGLFQSARFSTFLHETGHYYLELLGRMSLDPSAPPLLMQDMRTILQFLSRETGVEISDFRQLQRVHHEKWAETFEAYLAEGRAPAPWLQKMFDQFKNFLVALFRSAKDRGINMTPEIRRVMDGIVAPDPMKEARAYIKRLSLEERAARDVEAVLKDMEADPAPTRAADGSPVSRDLTMTDPETGQARPVDLGDDLLKGALEDVRGGADAIAARMEARVASGDDPAANIERAALDLAAEWEDKGRFLLEAVDAAADIARNGGDRDDIARFLSEARGVASEDARMIIDRIGRAADEEEAAPQPTSQERAVEIARAYHRGEVPADVLDGLSDEMLDAFSIEVQRLNDLDQGRPDAGTPPRNVVDEVRETMEAEMDDRMWAAVRYIEEDPGARHPEVMDDPQFNASEKAAITEALDQLARAIDEADPDGSQPLPMFFGPRAATADGDGLRAAERLKVSGAAPEEIRAATGWEETPTGWRFRADPDEVQFKDGALPRDLEQRSAPASAFLSAPQFERAYPGMLDRVEMTVMRLSRHQVDQYQGAYRPLIHGKSPRIIVEAHSDEAMRVIALHELSHLVQDLEGDLRPSGAQPNARDKSFAAYMLGREEVEARAAEVFAALPPEQRMTASMDALVDVSREIWDAGSRDLSVDQMAMVLRAYQQSEIRLGVPEQDVLRDPLASAITLFGPDHPQVNAVQARANPLPREGGSEPLFQRFGDDREPFELVTVRPQGKADMMSVQVRDGGEVKLNVEVEPVEGSGNGYTLHAAVSNALQRGRMTDRVAGLIADALEARGLRLLPPDKDQLFVKGFMFWWNRDPMLVAHDPRALALARFKMQGREGSRVTIKQLDGNGALISNPDDSLVKTWRLIEKNGGKTIRTEDVTPAAYRGKELSYQDTFQAEGVDPASAPFDIVAAKISRDLETVERAARRIAEDDLLEGLTTGGPELKFGAYSALDVISSSLFKRVEDFGGDIDAINDIIREASSVEGSLRSVGDLDAAVREAFGEEGSRAFREALADAAFTEYGSGRGVSRLVPERGDVTPRDGTDPLFNTLQRQRDADAGFEPVDHTIDRGGLHSPAGPKGGAPGFDVARDIYPDDIYGPNGLRYYGTGADLDPDAYQVLMQMKGDPDAPVTIYRAVDKGQKEILPGDWVTTVRAYAEDHGAANIPGDFDVLERRVTAKDIWTEGNSFLEWGYHPQPSWPKPKAPSPSDPLFQLLGEMAEGPQRPRLVTAKRMARAGRLAHEIRAETGWEKTPAGWRFELDPDELRLKTPEVKASAGARVSLSKLIDADRLFEAYPSLRNLQVVVAKRRGVKVTQATYAPGGRPPGDPRATNLVDLLAGTPRQNAREPVLTIDWAGDAKGLRGELEYGIQRAIFEIERGSAAAGRRGFEDDFASGGAIEARAARRRLWMTTEQRARSSLGSSADLSGALRDFDAGRATPEQAEALRAAIDAAFRRDFGVGRSEFEAASDPFYQNLRREPLEGFEMGSTRALARIKRRAGTPTEWRKELEAKGVKPKEFAALGWDAHAWSAKPDRAEVEAFIEANQPDLEVKTLGGGGRVAEVERTPWSGPRGEQGEFIRFADKENPGSSFEYILRLGDDGGYTVYHQGNPQTVGGLTLDQALHTARGHAASMIAGPEDAARFSSYAIPGGEPGTYREVLIRDRALDAQVGGRDDPAYTSPHFRDQEVVHLRMDDRQVDGVGRTLFVHEIQSDIHQDGRRYGYENRSKAELRDRMAEIQREVDALAADRDPVTNAMRDEARWHELIRERDAIDRRRPPRAALADNWTEVAVKQAFRMAAQEGYDAVSFARADQIASAVGGSVDDLSVQYDRTIPKFLTKYVRGLGGEVEMQERGGAGVNPLVRIAPEMREALVGTPERPASIPLFNTLGDTPRPPRADGSDPYLDIGRAASELRDDVLTASQVERRNALINGEARANLLRAGVEGLRRYGDPHLGVLKAMGGVNRTIDSMGASADARGEALAKQFQSGLATQLRSEGLLPAFMSGRFDNDIARALEDLSYNRPTRQGLDQDAVRIAKIVRRWQEATRRFSNQRGAWIRPLRGYISGQSHDPLYMQRTGMAGWVNYMMRDGVLDWERIPLEPGVARESFLEDAFRALTTGHRLAQNGGDTAADLAGALRGPRNVARSMSNHRLLHFKSADAFMAYQREFGQRSLAQSILSELDMKGRQIGLMQVFGTNPEAMLRLHVDDMKGQTVPTEMVRRRAGNLEGRQSPVQVRELRGAWWDPGYERLASDDGTPSTQLSAIMSDLTGEAAAAKHYSPAQWGSNIRAVQSMAKLGFATFSALGDVMMNANAWMQAGKDPFSAVMRAFASTIEGFRMARGLGDVEMREFMDVLGVGMEGTLGSIHTRLAEGADNTRWSNKWQDRFFKVIGMTQWTDAVRRGAAHMLLREMAINANRTFNQMNPRFARMLRDFGISEAEWRVASQHITTVHGREFMDIQALFRSLERGQDASNDAALELGTKLNAMVMEFAHTASPQPNARDRAIAHQGRQRGTWAGEGLRLMFQFKAFPLTVLRRHLGGMLVRDGGLTNAANAGQFAAFTVMAGIFGGAVIMIKDYLKGKTPRDIWADSDEETSFLGTPFRNDFMFAAFMQSGGFGLYGDLLLGNTNRFGGTPLDSVAGPTIGGALLGNNGVVQLARKSISSATQGELEAGIGGDWVRFFKSNTPFASAMPFKQVLDYNLVWWLQEVASPGYHERAAKRMLRDTNQEMGNDLYRAFGMQTPVEATEYGGGPVGRDIRRFFGGEE